jgi:hypothetical protein
MSDGSSGAATDTVPQSGSLDYEALSYVPYNQHGSGGQAWPTVHQPYSPLQQQHAPTQHPLQYHGPTWFQQQQYATAYGTADFGQPQSPHQATAEAFVQQQQPFYAPFNGHPAYGAPVQQLDPNTPAAWQQLLAAAPQQYDIQGVAGGYGPHPQQPHPPTQSPWSPQQPSPHPHLQAQASGTCTQPSGTCASPAAAELALAQAKADAAVAEAERAAERAAAAAELERVRLEARVAQLQAALEIEQLRQQSQQSPPPPTKVTLGPPKSAASSPSSLEEDADDDSDDADDASSVAASTVAALSASSRPLPTSAVTKLTKASKGLAPDTFEKFSKLFKNRCRKHHPSVAKLLALDVATWAAIAAGRTHDGDDELRGADEWLAQQLLDCLDPEATEVSNLIDVATEEQLDSGRALLDLCKQRMQLTLGSERRVAENTFNSLSPFKLNMQAADVEHAALEVIAKFKRLHLYNKEDPLSVRLMLIRKLAKVKKAEADKLEDDLFEADISASSVAAKLIEPWTERGLFKIIAMKLVSKGNSDPLANLADGKNGDVKCLSCGEPGHDSRSCTKKGSCRVKNCPCIYGATCLFTTAKKPSNVKHALGRQVSRGVFEGLLKEHKKRYPQAYASELDAQQGESAAAAAAAAAATATAGQQSTPSTAAAELGSAVSGQGGPQLQSHACELTCCSGAAPWPEPRPPHRTRAQQRTARSLAHARDRDAAADRRAAAQRADADRRAAAQRADADRRGAEHLARERARLAVVERRAAEQRAAGRARLADILGRHSDMLAARTGAASTAARSDAAPRATQHTVVGGRIVLPPSFHGRLPTRA